MDDGQTARSLPGRNPKPRELPAEAVEVLKQWLFSPEHFHNPYPTHEETADLSQRTGLKRIQIKNWFVNARRRCWKRAKANQQNALTSGAVGSVPVGTMGFTTPNAADHELSLAKGGGVMDMATVFNVKQGDHGVAAQGLAYHALPQHGMKPDYRSAYQGGAAVSALGSAVYEAQPMQRVFQIPPKSTMASSGPYLNTMLSIAPKMSQSRGSFQNVTFTMPNGMQPTFNISPSMGMGKPPKKEDLKAAGMPGAISSQGATNQKRPRNPNQPSWARYTPIEDRVLLDWAKTHHWKSPKGVKLWKELSQKWSTVAPNLPQRPWQSLRDRYLRLVHERKKKGKGDSKRAKVAVHDTHGVAASSDSRGSSSSALQLFASSDRMLHPNLSNSTESYGAGMPTRANPIVVRPDTRCAICNIDSSIEPVDGILRPCGHIVHVRCFFKCNQDFVRRSSQMQPDGVAGGESGPVPVPRCPVCNAEVLDCDSVQILASSDKAAPPAGRGIVQALECLDKVEPVPDMSAHPFMSALPSKYEEDASLRADVKDGQDDELFARFERASIDVWRVRLVKNTCAELLAKEEARIASVQDQLPDDLVDRSEQIKQNFSDAYAQIESQAISLGSSWRKPRSESMDSVGDKLEKDVMGAGNTFSKDSISSSVTDSCAPTPSQSMDFFGGGAGGAAGGSEGFTTTEQMEKACQVYVSFVELYCNTIHDLRQIK